jgi:hypothetical protein
MLGIVAYVLIYLGLRTGLSAQASNAAALLVTTLAAAEANRRFSVIPRGATEALRYRAETVFVFGVALALSSGYLFAAGVATPAPTRFVEVAALVLAGFAATVLRITLLVHWTLRRSAADAPLSSGQAPEFA